jgi:integrase
MSKEAKGTVEWRSGAWHARVTMPDKTRPWVRIPGIPKEEREKAVRMAAIIASRSRAIGAAPSIREETVSEWMARWKVVREREGISDARKQLSQFRLYVEEDIGTIAMKAVTREDLKSVVKRLDSLVDDENLKWKTAQNIWSFVARAFKDACSSKDESLVVLRANPAEGIRGPDKGTKTAKQYLYPNEFRMLVSCEAVPLWRRRVYAMAVYTYMRAGELDALDWEDMSLDHRIISVHRSRDRARPKSKVGSTKTDTERRVTIEPTLLPMLLAMADESRRGKVLRMPPGGGSDGESPLLREDLLRAGVTRKALHTTRKTTKRITFHDLRATGMTWAAIRGDDPLKIMSRSGHVTYSTMLTYVREAEVLKETGTFGEVFERLPECLTKRP